LLRVLCVYRLFLKFFVNVFIGVFAESRDFAFFFIDYLFFEDAGTELVCSSCILLVGFSFGNRSGRSNGAFLLSFKCRRMASARAPG